MRTDNNPALPCSNSINATDAPTTGDRSSANTQVSAPPTSAVPARSYPVHQHRRASEAVPSSPRCGVRRQGHPRGGVLGSAGAANIDEYLKNNKS